MLKFTCNNGNVTLKLNGDITTICADTTMLILTVYDHLKKSDKELANAFKNGITNAVNDGIAFGQDKKIKKPVENENDLIKKPVEDEDELLRTLKKLNELLDKEGF